MILRRRLWFGAALCGLWLSAALCQAAAHPVRVDANSDCVACHSDKVGGRYAHPALAQGCTACHAIENNGDECTVRLKTSKSSICFACHEASTFTDSHLSYASGSCTRCHDPHSSAQPRMLKARVNDLCLACHLQTPGAAPSHYLPKIELTANNTVGHPYAQHPVAGKTDPLSGSEMSCISCHAQHGTAKLHHLKMGGQIPADALNEVSETKDMCSECHQRLWGLDTRPTEKKSKRRK